MKAYLCLFASLGIATVGLFCQAADFPQAKAENQRAESLRNQQEAVNLRSELRQQIVADVIAGELTVPQAADRFLGLNGSEPRVLKAVKMTLPADSDKERLCQQVLLHVKAALEGRTSEGDTILPRLEKQMQEQKSEHTSGI